MAHVRTRTEDGEGGRQQGRVGMGRANGRGHHCCGPGQGVKKLAGVSKGRGGMQRRQRVSSHGASFGTR